MRLRYGWLPAQWANSTCLVGIRLPVLGAAQRRVFVNHQGSETHSLRTDGVRDMAGQTVPTTSDSRIAQHTAVSGSRESEAKVTGSAGQQKRSTANRASCGIENHSCVPDEWWEGQDRRHRGDSDEVGSGTRIGHRKAERCVTQICGYTATKRRGPGPRRDACLCR